MMKDSEYVKIKSVNPLSYFQESELIIKRKLQK